MVCIKHTNVNFLNIETDHLVDFFHLAKNIPEGVCK